MGKVRTFSKAKLGHICAVLAHNIATVMQSYTNLEKNNNGIAVKLPNAERVMSILKYLNRYSS